MPNAGDIHPSTFGHEIIGNALFSRIAPHLNLTADPQSLYTYSERFTAHSTELAD